MKETFDDDEMPFVVKRPIFDRGKNIWGYELIAEPLEHGECVDSEVDMVTVYGRAKDMSEQLLQDKKVLFNLRDDRPLRKEDFPDQWERCVFGICNYNANSQECIDFARQMAQDGGTVSVDEDVAPAVFEALGSNSDILRVSLKGKTPAEIAKLRRKYKEFKGELLATDVNSWEAYEGTRALGFSYFQGQFFKLPKISESGDLRSSSITKLQLLKELSNPHCEMDELASIISSDVSLSYRLLHYINSASFGLKNKIKSLSQAVSLLGLKEVRHWAMIVAMTDLDSTPRGEELSYMALQRARFISKLAKTIKGVPYSSSTLFMLGLFSNIDALMTHPMEKVLEDIPMDEPIKSALCGESNEYRDWLEMLSAVEDADWDTANRILKKYGACFTTAAVQYLKAATWAAEQMPNLKK